MRKIGDIAIVLSGLVFLAGGCVDVDQPNVSTVDYRAFMRVVNVAAVAATVTVDGATVASSLTTGNATNYVDLPAGSRKFAFAVGSARDTFNVGITPDSRWSYYVSSDPGNTTGLYVRSGERNTFEAPPANVALVRLLSMSADTAATITGGLRMVISYTRTDTAATKDSSFTGIAAGVGTKFISGNFNAPISYTVVGAQGDTLRNRINAGITSAGRYTIVMYGTRVSPLSKVFKED